MKKVVLTNLGRGKKIFLISPVRNVIQTERPKIVAYVQKLEAEGHRVHWPARDTPQDDSTGIDICLFNLDAITAANEVHIWYYQGSQGSIFDFGMIFALGKKLVLANGGSIERTPQKSFENVILEYATHG